MDTTLLQNFSQKQEVKALQTLFFQCKRPREFLRIMAVLMSFIFKPKDIAMILNIGESSVYRYLDGYKAFPDCFFQHRPGSGRPETLEQKHEILNCILDSPHAKGYYHNRWTCCLLHHHLSKVFSKPLSIESIRLTLKAARYNWKRVKHGPPSTPDPLAKEKLARIEKTKANLLKTETILYADEADFNLLCPIRSEWSPIGEQKVVTTPGNNQKIYAFGAYDPKNGRLIYSVRYRKRTREFIEFLYQVLNHYSGKIYLIVDNWIVHFGGRAKAFCERYRDRIEFLPIPTYSPQENKIERLWGIAKDLTSCNYTCQNLKELVTTAKRGLRMVQQSLSDKKMASQAVSLNL